jgi:hypothetical protein
MPVFNLVAGRQSHDRRHLPALRLRAPSRAAPCSGAPLGGRACSPSFGSLRTPGSATPDAALPVRALRRLAFAPRVVPVRPHRSRDQFSA